MTSTDSGLAVPDWPLSYGQVMPPMVGGIFYEHGHRMIATLVGILTTVLAFWLWRRESRPWVRNLGMIALIAVIVQGTLGGLTVLYLLPTPISVAHATLAQSFFSLTVILALITSKGWREHESPILPLVSKTRRLAVLASVAILVQLVLGAWMRHSAAGLAIPDFPLSYGGIFPPQGSTGLTFINDQRVRWLDLPPVESAQVWIHFAHRLGAIVATVAVVTCSLHILRSYRAEPRLREPALVMLLLVVVQLVFGALTVWTGKGVQIATIHVATGALLLATSVFVSARTFHLYKPSEHAPVSSFLTQPARL